jgi:hypothetical protein
MAESSPSIKERRKSFTLPEATLDAWADQATAKTGVKMPNLNL